MRLTSLLLVVLLAATATVSIQAAVDISCQRDNTDFWGADLHPYPKLWNTGVRDCANRCRDYGITKGSCKAITFRKYDGRCHLKFKEGGESGPSPNNDRISMNMDCKKYNKPVDMSCRRDNTDFREAHLKDFKSAGFEACVNFCRDSPDCKSITLQDSDNWCTLKTKQGGDRGPDPRNGYTSMNMNCDNTPVDMSCQRDTTDFSGADLRDFTTTGVEACANFCRDAYNCKAITFNTNNNRCYLKNKQGGENPKPDRRLISMNMDCDNTPVDVSCRSDNTSYRGANMRYFRCNSLRECANFCRDSEECKAISVSFVRDIAWHGVPRADICYLKNRRGGEGAYLNYDAMSMNVPC